MSSNPAGYLWHGSHRRVRQHEQQQQKLFGTNFSLNRISFTLAGFCKSPERSRTDDEKAKVRWTRRRGGAYVVRLEVAIGCRQWEHGQHDGQHQTNTRHIDRALRHQIYFGRISKIWYHGMNLWRATNDGGEDHGAAYKD